MKKTLTALALVLVLLCSLTITAGAVSFGGGIAVIAEDVTLIKTGLLGKKLSFNETDFKTALGISDFNLVKITELPDEEDGVLMFGGRKVKEGQEFRRRNISQLVFIPTSADVEEAEFKFSIDNYAAGESIKCIMKFIDKINYAPTIESSEETLSYTTQREISLFGKLEASDKEGDEIEYIIVSYPKNGTLTLLDDDKFRYTPKSEFSGNDAFTYVARDEYGNFSKPAEITLRVTERISEVVYVDMLDAPEYNASVALTGMGIMSGTRIGEDMYFQPDGKVTRAEFLTMAMRVLGIRADKNIGESFFDDNADIPAPHMAYVATAQRRGIVNGAFEDGQLKFRPNDAITKYEAGIIMANLVDLGEVSASENVSGIYDVPVWARERYSKLCTVGIFDTDSIGARDEITRADACEYLYRLASGFKKN